MEKSEIVTLWPTGKEDMDMVRILDRWNCVLFELIKMSDIDVSRRVNRMETNEGFGTWKNGKLRILIWDFIRIEFINLCICWIKMYSLINITRRQNVQKMIYRNWIKDEDRYVEEDMKERGWFWREKS